MPSLPRVEIVVTRHQPLVEYLVDQGLITAKTKVIDHADVSDVQGKHVLGVMPYHLACEATCVTEVPLNHTAEDREQMKRGDLTATRLREIAGAPVTYKVTKGRGTAKTAGQVSKEQARAWALGRRSISTFDLVVTQFSLTVEYAIEKGFITDKTKVIAYPELTEIHGKHVLGVVPYHFACEAASVSEIPLRRTFADRERRVELTLARFREIAGEPVTYIVSKVKG